MSIKVFVPLLLATRILEMVSCDPDLGSEWLKFKEKYNKAYTAEEDKVRFKIFSENYLLVEEHNKKDLGFKIGNNFFADWKEEEMKGLNGHYVAPDLAKNLSSRKSSYRAGLQSSAPLPEEWDWRKHGYVTSVKEQKNCGSCWAFATVATLETRYAVDTNLTLELSEQNLVDCAMARGCDGGNVEIGYEYIERNGIDSRGSYPYMGKTGTCRASEKEPVLTLTKFEYVPQSEDDLARAVVAKGAVAVAVDASNKKFKFYTSGILSLEDCKTNSPDHAMTVVGFGRDYWLLKNSWGEHWGERGYLRLARNKNNMCGISSHALYPVRVSGRGGTRVVPNSGFRFSLEAVFVILPLFVIFAH